VRPAGEVAFRLRQEAANLWLYLFPGRCPAAPRRLAYPAPPPATRDFHVPRPPVDWRRDPVSGVASPAIYFRRIPYLDPARAGDHKAIWDLNRHQELAVLAYRGEHARVEALLADWIAANPPGRGMNWTSALEAAFRALSWLAIWHAPGARIPPRFLDSLYAHGAHIRHNLSVYFSPNTHLLGEAVALHALGLFFGREDWRKRGRAIALDCLHTQVFPDGAYFEQSTYYHVYALDFFLLHHALEALPPETHGVLDRMAGYLRALLGAAGEMPLIGDDDGGRVHHPFSDPGSAVRESLARWRPVSSAASCPVASAFPDAGLYFLANDETQIIFDAGSFGRGSAGHSHADALQILARQGDEEILIDPGTYTYVADPAARDLFRGTAMHNTIRCGGFDQAQAAGPFRWRQLAEVSVISASGRQATAECRTSQGFVHRRTARYDPATALLEVEDRLEGPPGKQRIEQFWHFASDEATRRLSVDSLPEFALEAEPGLSFRSRRFGEMEAAPALRYSGQTSLPVTLRTFVNLSPGGKIAL
jgi:hypothetical protein